MLVIGLVLVLVIGLVIELVLVIGLVLRLVPSCRSASSKAPSSHKYSKWKLSTM